MYKVPHSKSQGNLGLKSFGVTDPGDDVGETGISGGADSKVSHCVVTTVPAAEVECLDGSCCGFGCNGEWPIEFLCRCDGRGGFPKFDVFS